MNTRSTKAKTVHFVVDILWWFEVKTRGVLIYFVNSRFGMKKLTKRHNLLIKGSNYRKKLKKFKIICSLQERHKFNSQKEFLTTPKWHNCISPILSLRWPRFDPWKILQRGFEIFSTRWCDRSFWWTMPIMDIESNHQYAAEKEPG